MRPTITPPIKPGPAVAATPSRSAKVTPASVMLFPDEYEILETWDTEGLRGTGSHDIRVRTQIIPKHRVVERDALLAAEAPGSKIHDHYAYRIQMAPFQKSWFAGPLLGTARGALKTYLQITKDRIGRLLGESIVDQEPVQIRIGETLADIETAELILSNYVRRLHDANHFNQKLWNDPLQHLFGVDTISFADFVEFVCRVPETYAEPHLRLQHTTLFRPDGSAVVDFVGRFEDIDRDLTRLSALLGVAVELPHKNRSNKDGQGYRDFFDANLRDKLSRRYELDLNSFSYTFE